jgi:hypothetical protein
MSRSTPRLAAAAILALSGVAILLVTLGLVAARLVIASGDLRVHVSAADAALIGDLAALSPFITAFAVAGLVSAVALASGRDWGDRLATAVATVATSIGAFALVLVTLGHDPFTDGSRIGASADGLGVIAAFIAVHVAVIAALAVAEAPARRPAQHRWSIPGAA